MQPIKRAIRRPEILAKTGLSATTIYNLEKRGEFPQHFMLTPRCAVWFEAEVDAWPQGPQHLGSRLRGGDGKWVFRVSPNSRIESTACVLIVES